MHHAPPPLIRCHRCGTVAHGKSGTALESRYEPCGHLDKTADLKVTELERLLGQVTGLERLLGQVPGLERVLGVAGNLTDVGPLPAGNPFEGIVASGNAFDPDTMTAKPGQFRDDLYRALRLIDSSEP